MAKLYVITCTQDMRGFYLDGVKTSKVAAETRRDELIKQGKQVVISTVEENAENCNSYLNRSSETSGNTGLVKKRILDKERGAAIAVFIKVKPLKVVGNFTVFTDGNTQNKNLNYVKVYFDLDQDFVIPFSTLARIESCRDNEVMDLINKRLRSIPTVDTFMARVHKGDLHSELISTWGYYFVETGQISVYEYTSMCKRYSTKGGVRLLK
ncbi:hypothetical protein D3C81_11230 [compost metagenome]